MLSDLRAYQSLLQNKTENAILWGLLSMFADYAAASWKTFSPRWPIVSIDLGPSLHQCSKDVNCG